MKSAGITGQLTRSRADTIIADDVEVVKNSATVTQREKLSEFIKEFDAKRAEELFDEQLRNFEDYVLGHKHGNVNFYDNY